MACARFLAKFGITLSAKHPSEKAQKPAHMPENFPKAKNGAHYAFFQSHMSGLYPPDIWLQTGHTRAEILYNEYNLKAFINEAAGPGAFISSHAIISWKNWTATILHRVELSSDDLVRHFVATSGLNPDGMAYTTADTSSPPLMRMDRAEWPVIIIHAWRYDMTLFTTGTLDHETDYRTLCHEQPREAFVRRFYGRIDPQDVSINRRWRIIAVQNEGGPANGQSIIYALTNEGRVHEYDGGDERHFREGNNEGGAVDEEAVAGMNENQLTRTTSQVMGSHPQRLDRPARDAYQSWTFRTSNKNAFSMSKIATGEDVRTTIMLRNIPNRMDQPTFKMFLDQYVAGLYDFYYLRIDFANSCNVGYAFINFASCEGLLRFSQCVSGQRWNASDKIAEISYATIQGRESLIEKFRNSSVLQEAFECRPHLVFTNGHPLCGQDEQFPTPNNLLKLARSTQNAALIGLYNPTRGGPAHHLEERRRRGVFDRGTPAATIEQLVAENNLLRAMNNLSLANQSPM